MALIISMVLVAIVSTIELGFVTSMVNWLIHTSAWGYDFRSNGAAGTGLVLIAFGGALALSLRTKAGQPRGLGRNIIYYIWLVVSVLAFFLTTGALGYVFQVTNAHAGQTIDVPFAATLVDRAYPLLEWTPRNWYEAVLQLDLVDKRADIESHLWVMRGWQYNLIPMFLFQLCQSVLAIAEFMEWRRASPPAPKYGEGSPLYSSA
jgi:hypothetical protein